MNIYASWYSIKEMHTIFNKTRTSKLILFIWRNLQQSASITDFELSKGYNPPRNYLFKTGNRKLEQSVKYVQN